MLDLDAKVSMFGWRKKSDSEVVATTSSQLDKLMVLLRMRLGSLPIELADDGYLVGFVSRASALHVNTERDGNPSAHLLDDASVSSLQRLFYPHHGFTMAQSAAALSKHRDTDDARRGARAAELIAGASQGIAFDDEADVEAARKAIRELPAALQLALGNTDAERTATMLEEKLFLGPLVKKYKVRPVSSGSSGSGASGAG